MPFQLHAQEVEREKNLRGERGNSGQGDTWSRTSGKSRQNSPRDKIELARIHRKGQNRGIIPQKKLALICECYKYVNKYKPQNKITFWKMIWVLFKDRTEYNLLESRITITR